MSKKVHILMLFLTLAFLLNPVHNYACNTMDHKEMSKKEENSCSKKCCQKKNTKKEEKHNCDGKCRHAGCNTSTMQHIILNSNEFDLQKNVFNFSLKNTFTYYADLTISAGFTSIWQPPKI